MKRFLILFILSVFIMLSVPGISQADIYMKQKRHTDATRVMGVQQPAKDVAEEVWITDKGFRSDNPESSTIMIPDQHKMIMLDHVHKTYTVQSMDMDRMAAGMPHGNDAEEAAAFKGMMHNMMKMDAKVQATGERKKIKGWNCRKYILTLNTFMGKITNEIWATQDLKVDKGLYDRFTSQMMSFMPGMQSSMKGFYQEMKKIKGVQVLSVSTHQMMNQTHKTRTELLEYKHKKAPKGLFKIPAGYRMQTD